MPSPSPSALIGAHVRTPQTIFHHPVARILRWRDLVGLFRQLGQIEEVPNGNLKVTRNGQTLVVRPPRTRNASGGDELMKIRRFLERSEKHAPTATGPNGRWLVVVNHLRPAFPAPGGTTRSPAGSGVTRPTQPSAAPRILTIFRGPGDTGGAPRPMTR